MFCDWNKCLVRRDGLRPAVGDGAERPLEAIATLEIYDLTLDLE
ncbi:MAG: hypothetical protein V7K53_25765 [Nostoc sp.]